MVICVKVFGVFLMFIKLSSYSNLITHMFVISLHVVHFITSFINRQSMCCFLSNQVLYLFKFYPLDKMENLSNRIVLCKVQNFIKTGAFTVFGRNLWPIDNRYQYGQL